MRPHKNSCVVFVETMGENRVVPLSAIKTIPSVSWMVPNYQSRGRSEKKKKRNWHLNELSSNKCSKINDDFHEKWSQGELLQVNIVVARPSVIYCTLNYLLTFACSNFRTVES